MTDRQTYRTYLYFRPDIQDLRIYAISRRIKRYLTNFFTLNKHETIDKNRK